LRSDQVLPPRPERIPGAFPVADNTAPVQVEPAVLSPIGEGAGIIRAAREPLLRQGVRMALALSFDSCFGGTTVGVFGDGRVLEAVLGVLAADVHDRALAAVASPRPPGTVRTFAGKNGEVETASRAFAGLGHGGRLHAWVSFSDGLLMASLHTAVSGRAGCPALCQCGLLIQQ
jgi:hypothetical protein